MRTLLVTFLLAIGCAHSEPAQTGPNDQATLEQIRDEQRAEAAKADKHRRFERQQAVWNASQAPFKSN